jgi:hypothetical protein
MPTLPTCPVTQVSSGAENDAGCVEDLRVVWVGIAALTPPYALHFSGFLVTLERTLG